MRPNAANTRATGLDKFYTRPAVAAQCIREIADWQQWSLVVEPSAGNGSFLANIPTANKIDMDIAPEHPDILRADFFTYVPPPAGLGRILVIGNPPFGKSGSLAVRFFNHAATFAHTIAFIVPRTFRRISVQNKLCMQFRLVSDTELPTRPCCFEPPMMAKCCFQIWQKCPADVPRRSIILPTVHADWTFLPFGPLDDKKQPTPPVNADFAIRAYGGRCGEICVANLHVLRPKSWHWIQARRPIPDLIDVFRQLDYRVSLDTARQNSIGRGELVQLYAEFVAATS